MTGRNNGSLWSRLAGILGGGAALMLALAFFPSETTAASRGISMQSVPTAVETPFVAGRYRALIIGNDDYRDPEKHWPSLLTAVSDASAVADVLSSNYGFDDVTLLTNATRRDILLALSKLSSKVMPNDSVLVYYAGHGFMDAETRRGYWVPVDAQGADQTTYLRNSTIRDEMSTIAARGRHTLLIADSCFSGSLLRSGTRGLPPETGSERYYEKVARKKSVQVMAAGGVEYVDDGYQTTGHSPFTYFLLNELKYNDKPLLTVSELSQNVEKAVANNATQVPESGVLQGAGDELGEFIFINIDVSVSGAAADRVKVKVNMKPQAANTPVETETSDAVASPGTAPGNQLLPMPTL